jgi:hypothetical protein
MRVDNDVPFPKKEYRIKLDLTGSYFACYFRGRGRLYAKDSVSKLACEGKLLPCGWYMAQHDFHMDWDGNVVSMFHPYEARGKTGPCGLRLPMKLREFMELIKEGRIQWMRENYAKFDEPDGSYGEH